MESIDLVTPVHSRRIITVHYTVQSFFCSAIVFSSLQFFNPFVKANISLSDVDFILCCCNRAEWPELILSSTPEKKKKKKGWRIFKS